MSDYDFSKKVLVLTGASGGIGLATAEYFFKCGASIAATYNENLAITELVSFEWFKIKSFRNFIQNSVSGLCHTTLSGLTFFSKLLFES